MTVAVRAAVLDDAAGIARVHVAAWRETHSRLLPEGALNRLDDELDGRTRRWHHILHDRTTTVLVTETAAGVVGWCSVGMARDEDAPRELELQGIYLLATHHGSGAGQTMLDTGLGNRPAYLWSAVDNRRAQAFYRRNGFTADGARKQYPLAGHSVSIARFVR